MYILDSKKNANTYCIFDLMMMYNVFIIHLKKAVQY